MDSFIVELIREELSIYGARYELDGETISKATKVATADVKASEGNFLHDIFSLRADMRLQVVQAIESEIPAEEFALIVSDLEERMEQETAAAKDAIVLFFDQQLILSPEQMTGFRENMDPEFVQRFHFDSLCVYDPYFGNLYEGITFENLQKTLNESQAAALESMNLNYRHCDEFFYSFVDDFVPDEEKKRLESQAVESLLNQSIRIIDCKLDEIEIVSGLNENQKKRLTILAKGIADATVESKVDAMKNLEWNLGTTTDTKVAHRSLSMSIFQSERWLKSLSKTLDEAQMEKYVARENLRQGFRQTAILRGSIEIFMEGMGTRAKDVNTIYEFFETKTEVKDMIFAADGLDFLAANLDQEFLETIELPRGGNLAVELAAFVGDGLGMNIEPEEDNLDLNENSAPPPGDAEEPTVVEPEPAESGDGNDDG